MSALPLAWQHLVAEVNGRRELGMPGVRDHKYPCELFDPVDAPKGTGECRTDGHYLCTECSRISREAVEWREDA